MDAGDSPLGITIFVHWWAGIIPLHFVHVKYSVFVSTYPVRILWQQWHFTCTYCKTWGGPKSPHFGHLRRMSPSWMPTMSFWPQLGHTRSFVSPMLVFLLVTVYGDVICADLFATERTTDESLPIGKSNFYLFTACGAINLLFHLFSSYDSWAGCDWPKTHLAIGLVSAISATNFYTNCWHWYVAVQQLYVSIS